MRAIDADALDEVVLNLNANRNFGITRSEYKLIDSVLFEFPTIEERKKGKWLTSDDMYETGICSCCRYDTQEPVSYVITNFKHCPNCGAKMEGEEGDENG